MMKVNWAALGKALCERRQVATWASLGALVPLVGYTLRAVLSHRRGGTWQDEECFFRNGPPLRTWPTEIVTSWLRTIGVTRATVKLAMRYRLTGAAVATATMRSLTRMGIAARDARLILAARADLDRDSDTERDQASRDEAGGDDSLRAQSKMAETFVSDAAQLLRRIIAPDRSDAGEVMDVTSVARRRCEMASQLHHLFDLFHALSAREQAGVMLPLGRQFGLLTAPLLALPLEADTPPEGGYASESRPSHDLPAPGEPRSEQNVPIELMTEAVVATTDSPASSEVLTRRVKPMYDMLDNLLEFLRTPDAMQSVRSNAELDRVCQGVEGQVRNLMQAAQSMPPQIAFPLQQRCTEVMRLLQEARQRTQPALASAEEQVATAALHGTGNVLELMTELQALFNRVKDPALLRASPATRLTTVRAMQEEAERLREAIVTITDESAAAILRDVAGSVLTVLRHMEQLSLEEAAQERRSEASPTQSTTPVAPVTLAGLHRELQSTLDAIQSPAFAAATPTTRLRLVQDANARVGQVALAAQQAPAAEQRLIQPVLTALQKHLGELQTSIQADCTAMSQETSAVANTHNDDETDDEEDEAHDASAEDEALALNAALRCVSDVHTQLNSPDFVDGDAASQRAMAAEMLASLAKARPVLDASRAAGVAAVRDLIAMLEPPLRRLAAPTAATEVDEAGQSDAFRRIARELREIDTELRASDFDTAAPEERRRRLRVVFTRLDALTSGFASLTADEQAAAAELVEPVNQRLARLVTALRQGAETTLTSPSHGTVELPSVQVIIADVQEMMRTIQTTEFMTMSEAARGGLTTNWIAKLERYKRACDNLGASGHTLLPLIDHLLTQLQELVDAMRHVTPQPAATQDATEQLTSDDSRRELFTSVSNVARVLRQNAERGLQLGHAEVEQLEGLLRLVDSVVAPTADERRCRDDFASALEEARGNIRASATDTDPTRAQAEAGDAVTTRAAGLATLTSALHHIQAELAASTAPLSLADLAKLQLELETALDDADDTCLHWRDDAATMTLVRSTLTALREAGARCVRADRTRSTADDTQGAPEAAGAGDAGQTDFEQGVSEALLAISHRLRNENQVPEEILDEYTHILDQLATRVQKGAILDSIASVKEQVNLQRISNAADADERTGSTTAQTAAAQTPRDAAAFVEDDGDNSTAAEAAPQQTAGKTVTSQLIHHTAVPGGAENELHLLLPRIERRLDLPAARFAAESSLFDVQCISKVMLHLSALLHREEGQRGDRGARLAEMKKRFITLLDAFHQSSNASTAAEAAKAMRVQGVDVTDAEGNKERALTIFTDAESEQFSAGEAMAQTWSDAKNCVHRDATAETTESWTGRSMALLVYRPKTGAEAEADTALSELVLLHEILTHRYHFDVHVLTDPTLSATTFEEVLRQAVAINPSRLLVYYYTPKLHVNVAVPYAETFHDYSVLSNRSVLQVTAAVARVVVVHCQPRRLEVICRKDACISPTMSVTLTSKAATTVEQFRCWLYDGIFTPLIVELLSLDERPTLCPEDLVNYVVTATTHTAITFGSFTDNEAASMVYFASLE